jgi:hypothetical protein
VIAAIRSLRQAVDSLIGAVSRVTSTNLNPEKLVQPIEEVFLSWANLRPDLQRAGLDPAIVERLDKRFTNLIRLTVGPASKRSYLAQLNEIHEVVVGGLNNFAIKTALVPLSHAPALASPLIPEISDLPNDFVPRPLLGWLPEIRKFLAEFPFENNVFIMIAYRAKLETLLDALKGIVRSFDLNPVVAKDNRLMDDLYNPIANLVCCKYGIAIFDRGEPGQKHNSNVVYELAVMQTLKRPCIIVKHSAVKSMPSDFLHKLYEAYSTNQVAIEKVTTWLRTVKPDVER